MTLGLRILLVVVGFALFSIAALAQKVDTLSYKVDFSQTIPSDDRLSIQKLVSSKVGIYSFEYANKNSAAILVVNREIDEEVIRNLFGRLGVELKKCEMLPLQPIKD